MNPNAFVHLNFASTANAENFLICLGSIPTAVKTIANYQQPARNAVKAACGADTPEDTEIACTTAS